MSFRKLEKERTSAVEDISAARGSQVGSSHELPVVKVPSYNQKYD